MHSQGERWGWVVVVVVRWLGGAGSVARDAGLVMRGWDWWGGGDVAD